MPSRVRILIAAVLCILMVGGNAMAGNYRKRQCRASTFAAVGRKVLGLLKCRARAERSGETLSSTCLAKVANRFEKQFPGAKLAKSCLTTADKQLYEGLIEAAVAEVVAGANGSVADDLTPCWMNAMDTWSFPVHEGDDIEIRVDTADRATAADMALYLSCDLGTVFYSPVQFACAYPSPSGLSDCPGASFHAAQNDSCSVQLVSMGGPTCSNRHIARYVMKITANGKPIAPELVQNQ